MADINECKRLLEFRVTKAGFNGNLSPDAFNLIWNRAEQRHFNNEYKIYGANKSNTDSLVPFKSDPTTITIDGAGKFTKPNTLLHVDAIRNVGGNPLTEVTDDKLGSHLSSVYDAPALFDPIYVEYKTYLQFYPITLGSAVMVSLNKLVPSRWGYTLVANRPVYNVGTSVQPLWNDSDIDTIIYMAGVDMGLNMRDSMEIQVNDVKAKETA